MNKKKISKFGNVDIPADDFKDENVRIQISIKMPMNLLKAYREAAAQQSKGYQTLMIETLRKALPLSDEWRPFLTNEFKNNQNIIEILKKIENVEHRVESIEEALPRRKRAW